MRIEIIYIFVPSCFKHYVSYSKDNGILVLNKMLFVRLIYYDVEKIRVCDFQISSMSSQNYITCCKFCTTNYLLILRTFTVIDYLKQYN